MMPRPCMQLRFPRTVTLFLVSLFASHVAMAQVTTASILGTAKDETGAVLPGVTVTVTNQETGIARVVFTDDAGRYRAAQLALGDDYRIEAELTGFQKSIRQGISLTLGREAVVDLLMTIGDIAEQIVVQGEAPLIQSTNASVSGHIDQRQMRELPLNSRSYIDLSLLQAGTLQSRTGVSDSLGDGGTTLTVAGARPTATTFLLDGTSTTSVRGKAPASVAGVALGVDSIREFEVITSPYSAEYGRGTGGTISVVSKAGTNSLHGSVFEFLRNSDMDARNFFDPLEGPPAFRRNQFGFSLGGPVLRNRTFFFGNYEGLRQRLGQTAIFTVPNDATRQGNVAGRAVAINPAVRPYLDLYPRANGRDFGDGTAEYSAASSRPTDEDFFAVRIDNQLSSNQSVFGRYTYSNARDKQPGSLLMFQETNTSRSHFLTMEHKAILSSRLLNVVRFGLTRHDVLAVEEALFEVPPGLSLQEGTIMPRIQPTGLAALGSGDLLPQGFQDTTYEFYDSLTATLGSHTIKAGAQLQFLQNRAESNTRQASRWNFSSIDNFLLGRANRVQISPRALADPIRNFRQRFLAAFFQDDIRLTPRLTLNAGLRLEYAGTISEADGKLASMPIDTFATATVDDIVTGDPWYDNPGLTVGPRMGLAWDPFGDGKTAVRGGFGIFYDHLWSWWISGTGAYRMAPFYSTFDLRETLAFPQTADQFVALLRARQGRAVPAGNQVYEPAPNPARQYMRQFGVDVQRQLAGNLVVKLGYKGSRGVNLPRVADLNTAVPVSVDDGVPTFSATPRAPNPAYGTMLVMLTDSASFYNALLAEVSQRFSGGLRFQAAYTWSKLIDEGSGVRTAGDGIAGAGAGTVLSWQFPELDRGLSTFHLSHNLVANVGVELPFGAGRRVNLQGVADALLGGWELQTIVSLATGNAAEITMGTTSSTILLGGRRRPDLVSGGSNSPVLGGPDAYFDTSQFAPASPLRYGNVGRNTLIGPGYANVDFSVIKNFRVRTYRISLRGEVFNLLNRANFSLPDTNVFNGAGRLSGSAGRITSTAATARQVQLGVRLDW